MRRYEESNYKLTQGNLNPYFIAYNDEKEQHYGDG
jgi:hypothetical protein